MTAITASQVQALRKMTGAGMMDCKKALAENDGNPEAAVDWLRKKGIAKAAAKSDRSAHEGLIASEANGQTGLLLHLRSETDFVARNDLFQEKARALARHALTMGEGVDDASLLQTQMDGKPVSDHILELSAAIGENISLGEVRCLTAPSVLGRYLHTVASDGLGRIGVMVALQCPKPSEELTLAAKQIAMHIAAMNPLARTSDELPADIVAREKDIISERANQSGKDAAIVEKMITGGIEKWQKEVVLMEQSFIMDDSLTIEQLLQQLSHQNGGTVMVTDYCRLAVGDS